MHGLHASETGRECAHFVILTRLLYGYGKLARSSSTPHGMTWKCGPRSLSACLGQHLQLPWPSLEISRSPDDNYYEDLLGRYSTIRRFLPLLLQTVHFECVGAGGAGQPVLEGWRFLKSIEGQHRPAMRLAPRAVINRSWRRVVFAHAQPVLMSQHQQDQQQHSGDQDKQDHEHRQSDQVHHHSRQIDRRYYTFCVSERLQNMVYEAETSSHIPANAGVIPTAKLLQGPAWESLRPKICLGLDHSPTPEVELNALARQLDEAYRRTAENLPANSAVRIERIDGRDTPILTGLDKLDEPPSLQLLRAQVEALLPRVDLPEAILEVQEWTGFASEFTHVSEGNARVEDLPLSICAVLLAKPATLGWSHSSRQSAGADAGRLAGCSRITFALKHSPRPMPAWLIITAHLPLARRGVAVRWPRLTGCASWCQYGR